MLQESSDPPEDASQRSSLPPGSEPEAPAGPKLVDQLGFSVPDGEREAYLRQAQESASREAKFMRKWKALLHAENWEAGFPSRAQRVFLLSVSLLSQQSFQAPSCSRPAAFGTSSTRVFRWPTARACAARRPRIFLSLFFPRRFNRQRAPSVLVPCADLDVALAGQRPARAGARRILQGAPEVRRGRGQRHR
jgi:hypothetical protein